MSGDFESAISIRPSRNGALRPPVLYDGGRVVGGTRIITDLAVVLLGLVGARFAPRFPAAINRTASCQVPAFTMMTRPAANACSQSLAGDPTKGLAAYRTLSPVHVRACCRSGELDPRCLSKLKGFAECNRLLKKFADREGVSVTTVFNGCGILCATMKTMGDAKAAKFPDAYYACDLCFVPPVAEQFPEAVMLTETDIGIVVRKGNPKNIKTWDDLVKPGVTTEFLDKTCFEFAMDHKAYPAPLHYRGFTKSICTSSVPPSGNCTWKKPAPLMATSSELPVCCRLPWVKIRSVATGRTPVPNCIPDGNCVCWDD